MNLKKAKEIIDENVKTKPPGMNHDYFDALEIGSQAIKRIMAIRAHKAYSVFPLLPGETEK